MNLPNKLTLSRIILALIFIPILFSPGALMKSAALAVFLLAALTDYLDGKIARETQQITPFGQLMDPIADKLLTLSAFISFVQLGVLPAWMVVIVLMRDILITTVRLTVPPAESKKTEARQSGKHKTLLQMVAIITILLFLAAKETSYWNPAWDAAALATIDYVMITIVVLTLWSGGRFLVNFLKVSNA